MNINNNTPEERKETSEIVNNILSNEEAFPNTGMTFKYVITFTDGTTREVESNSPPQMIPGLIAYKLSNGNELLLIPFSVRHIELVGMPVPVEAGKIILPDNVVSPGGFNLGGN